MPSPVTAIRILPSASRLVHSLRDLGYGFPQAVADIIDNSVAAGATSISVDLRFEGRDSCHGSLGTAESRCTSYITYRGTAAYR